MDVLYAAAISNSTAYATIVFFLIIALLRVCRSPAFNKNKAHSLPPGPPPWPIVGHLHLLRKDHPFHRTMWSLAQQYGPIMHLRLGCRPILIVSSAQLARECLSTNDRIFASRPQFAAAEHLGYNSTMVGILPYNQQWRNLRKIITLEVLSSRRIEAWKHVRTEEISALVRSLFHQARANEKVNVRPLLLELTFNIVLRMLAGTQIFGPTNNNKNGIRGDEARQVHEMVEEFGLLVGAFNIGDYIPFLRFLDLQGSERAMKTLHKRSDAFLQRILEQHRRGHPDAHGDFLDVLLRSLSNDDYLVKSTAMALIVAATDTSSTTLEWALASLLQRSEICEKAQRELDDHIGRDRAVEESDLPKLKYLQAIVKETLRLYPPLPLLLPHQSTNACRVGEYCVPAGTRLLVNAWAIQRDPALWERPLEFEPERFINSSVDVLGQDFELIPFGAGRRACPGASLALRVVQLTLARVLQSFNWQAPDGDGIDMTEHLNTSIGLVRASALEAIVKPRLPNSFYNQ